MMSQKIVLKLWQNFWRKWDDIDVSKSEDYEEYKLDDELEQDDFDKNSGTTWHHSTTIALLLAHLWRSFVEQLKQKNV